MQREHGVDTVTALLDYVIVTSGPRKLAGKRTGTEGVHKWWLPVLVPLKSDTADTWRTYKALGFRHVGNAVSLDVREGPPRVDRFQ